VNILIVGAAGNLGSHVMKFLMSGPHRLRLLTHKRTLPFDMSEGANVEIVHGDLADRASLPDICAGINCIVYVAGVLFRPYPERFLRLTNTVYAETIVDAALAARVQKFILVSFPHVEEHTTPDTPARAYLRFMPSRSMRALGSKLKNICFVRVKAAA